MITARHDNVRGFAKMEISRSRPHEAVRLFQCRRDQDRDRGTAARREAQTFNPSTAGVLHDIAHRPLAIMFAATCCLSMEPNSADDSLRILQREDVPECGSLDHLNRKWAYHVFEDLNASESYLLATLCTFDTYWMTEDFFGVLGEVEAHACIFSQRQYRTPLNRLLKLGLVYRNRNPVHVAYTVPMAIKELFLHFLSVTKAHGGLATVISGSCELLRLVPGIIAEAPADEL